jgi:pimeloyl-ACP methyl ester carboxylesterase
MAKKNYEEFLTDDGTSLAYIDEGSGPAVILVAGYSAPAVSWKYQTKALNEAGFRTIAFDRRNHGWSAKTATGNDLLTHGKDIAALIETLSIEKPVVIGQSMGAGAFFAYLSQFGDGNIKGFIDVDQTPKMINDDGWQYGMNGLREDNFDDFFSKELPRPNHRKPSLKVTTMLVKALASTPKFDQEATRPLLLDHARSDWRQTIADAEIPMLFIAGRQSPMWPYGHAEASAAIAKNAEFKIIEDCGHTVTFEQPEESNRVIVEYVKKLFNEK